MNKTEQATQALLEAPDVTNRGHAFVILQQRGLTGSGRVFNGAVKAFELARGVELGRSAGRQRADDDKSNRACAHQTSAEDVLDHINSIDEADQLFWAYWKVFKHEGKWSNILKASDFAVHFKSRN